MIQIKRIYDEWDTDDGFRVLVDRLWPRGVAKKHAHIDLWLKDIAPSTELRKWFGHDVGKWDMFQKKYRTELQEKRDLLREIKELEKEHKTVTLLYAARDTEHNEAVIVLEMLQK